MEKYGEIPKKFTAKWFEYVWEYYKWHIIVGIAVIAAVIYTWNTVVNRTIYDLTVCFSGNSVISEQAKEVLTASLAEVIEDVNGDGEKNVKILDISIGETDDIEFTYVMEQKFYLELQAGESYLYIISEDRVDRLMNDSSADGLFEPTESWHGTSGENKLFLPIEKSELLTKAGVVYGGLHAGIRNFVAGANGENDQALRSNALLAAAAITG